MESYLAVFNTLGVIISILGVIWVAAVKITRLEVKVDLMWKERDRDRDK